MDVDIVCVGFGPATAGFLTHARPRPRNLESRAAPGMPLQVICYERADDIGFGVSGVVTRARGIRATMPDLDPSQIPMAAPVAAREAGLPARPRRRQPPLARAAFRRRVARVLWPARNCAVELPYLPPFLRKDGGLVMSIGQFMQFVGGQADGLRHGADLARHAGGRGAGRRRQGRRRAARRPGRGPRGPPGHRLSARHGHPRRTDRGGRWAGGRRRPAARRNSACRRPSSARMGRGHEDGGRSARRRGSAAGHRASTPSAIPSRRSSASSTCIRNAWPAVGIFVPSWFRSPVRTAYRYLQHFMLHPYLVALSAGRQAALVGRQVAAGIGPARRTVPGRRRLRAHRRGLGQHQRADRLGRG